MALIRSLFWFAIFVALTFAFTVLFEHGPNNYVENAKKEYEVLKKLAGSKLERKPDTSDQLPQ
jgi:hypothetical protein